MGRKKIIGDEDLLRLIDEYYETVCVRDGKRLKLPEICTFIRENGYPEYQDYILRRNKPAVAHIEALRSSGEEMGASFLSAYKTLDVESFLARNSGRKALTKALTELDRYYEAVSSRAVEVFQKNKKLEEKNSENMAELKKLNSRIADLENQIADQSEKLKNIKQENAAYKKVVDAYIYPEIANELLKKSGFLQNTQGIIKEEALESEIIHSDTVVKSKSNVIQGLFDSLQE